MVYKKRQRKQKIAFLLTALILLTGCGKQFQAEEPEDTITPQDENLIVVGVSQLGSESVWRTANTASIQSVFTKENGYFLIFDNGRQKQENQIKAIRSFISQQVDYIVFSPLTEDGWDTVLREAKDAGIPVILMDRKVKVEDESLYTSWVGSDFVEEGKKAGRWLASHLKATGREDEEINIVVLLGTEGATSVIGRKEGFEYIASMHDNWNILEQVDADFTTAKSVEEMRKMLEKYDDIDVVVSQNDDMTFGALDAIEQTGRTTGVDGEILMISFDAVKPALEMVEDGIINVDVECNPEQGEYIERIIQDLEKGETIEKEYYIPEEVFTQDNVSDALEDRNY